MREVHVSEVTALVRRLCMEANYHLPEDIQQSFVRGKEAEQSPLGKTIFDEMIRNCRLACDQEVPICQDTGTAVIFASVGQDVHLVGGAFEDAVNEGVRQGYTDGYLRKSIVSDPLRRVNTNDNTPAVVHTRLVPGEEIEIIVAPKGGGSENMSALKMFTPAATRDQIVAYIADTVIAAGSNPCPPVIIGVGLGGTADKASELAKKALLRPVDVHSADEFYAEMERDILERVNKSGVGPQGLGGTVTALACAIEPYPTHIASLPCAISIGCHITRHAAGRI
ncbi:fumarate hydratase [Butyricicoccus pullicaecorum]|uniref:fumarate hydratase n=1 Tax=Butyricicoccus pullicaecorum TaxID=501571 RepID=UPI003521DE53